MKSCGFKGNEFKVGCPDIPEAINKYLLAAATNLYANQKYDLKQHIDRKKFETVKTYKENIEIYNDTELSQLKKLTWQ